MQQGLGVQINCPVSSSWCIISKIFYPHPKFFLYTPFFSLSICYIDGWYSGQRLAVNQISSFQDPNLQPNQGQLSLCNDTKARPCLAPLLSLVAFLRCFSISPKVLVMVRF